MQKILVRPSHIQVNEVISNMTESLRALLMINEGILQGEVTIHQRIVLLCLVHLTQ